MSFSIKTLSTLTAAYKTGKQQGPTMQPQATTLRTVMPCDRKGTEGTSLMVQWLRLQFPMREGPGLIPGRGTRSHMLQLKVCMPRLKIPHARTKTWHRQINTLKKKKELKKKSCMSVHTHVFLLSFFIFLFTCIYISYIYTHTTESLCYTPETTMILYIH